MRPGIIPLLVLLLVPSTPAGAQGFASTSTIVAAGGGPIQSDRFVTTSTIGGAVAGAATGTAPDGGVVSLVGGFAPTLQRADAQPSLTLATPAAVPASGASRVVLVGRRLTDVRRVTVGGVEARFESGLDGTRLVIDVPPGAPGAADIVLTTSAGQRTLTGGVAYEPRWLRYFAEGAQSSWFDTRLAVFNPESEPVVASVTFAVDGRDASLPPLTTTITIPAAGRVTVSPADLVGEGAFATVIEASSPIVAERTMQWPAGPVVASHTEAAGTPPSDRWYFAEGSLHRGLTTFYLLQNTAAVEARVQARFFATWPSAPTTTQYVLPPHSRTTIWLDDQARTRPELAGLAGAPELAAEFVSLPYRDARGHEVPAAPIVAERALYLRDRATGAMRGGTVAMGSTLLGRQWHFAEGATGPFFDMWLLLANPGPVDAVAQVRYRRADGASFHKQYDVHAGSRISILVDEEASLSGIDGTGTPAAGERPLSATALATTVSASAPIVAERSLWWPGDEPTWADGHTSAGIGTPAERWAVAGAPAAAASRTYLLVSNASDRDGLVRVTPTCDGLGVLAARTFRLGAARRINVVAEADSRADAEGHALDGSGFGEAVVGRGCAFLVEAVALQGGAPPQLVVERATYLATGDGRALGAGAGAAATVLR